MKIVGGSFGLKGSARINNGSLLIKGTRSMECPPSSFKSVKARQDANRKFGVLGAIVGSMLFGALGFMFMGLFGAVLGILLSIAGSFYSVKKRFVEIDLISGESVTLECSSAEVDQILRL